MKMIYDVVLGITLSLFFSGCVTTKTIGNEAEKQKESAVLVYFIPDKIDIKKIIITDHKTVVDICGENTDLWDDGTKIKDKNKIGACFDYVTRTMVLDILLPQLWLHETCHAIGYPDAFCGTVSWPTIEDLKRVETRDLTRKKLHAIIYKGVKNARDKRVIKLPQDF